MSLLKRANQIPSLPVGNNVRLPIGAEGATLDVRLGPMASGDAGRGFHHLSVIHRQQTESHVGFQTEARGSPSVSHLNFLLFY